MYAHTPAYTNWRNRAVSIAGKAILRPYYGAIGPSERTQNVLQQAVEQGEGAAATQAFSS